MREKSLKKKEKRGSRQTEKVVVGTMQSTRIEKMVDVITIGSILWFLLMYFDPQLLLLKTTTDGGDTCAHNYLAAYMKDYLLPHGKLFGWSPGWWAGFPMFQYYFFMPYLMTALIAYVIPIEIAFKLVSVLGVFTLPIVTYISLKYMGLKFPVPSVGSALSLLFLFHENQKIWGMNIPSTLTGEISVSISFSAMILFLGLLYRDMNEGKFRIKNSIIFAFLILTHLTTTLVAGLTSLFFLLSKSRQKVLENIVILFKTYLIAFLLTAFWTLSIISKMEYSVGFGEEWSISHISLYPREAVVAAFFAAYGLIVAFRRRENAIFYLLLSTLSSVLLFYNAYKLNLVNIRFWPFHYYYLFLIAAYGLASFIEHVFSVADRLLRQQWLSEFSRRILPLVVMALIVVYLDRSITFTKEWIRGNYEGFESKMAWSNYRGILDTINGTPGRAANDLSSLNVPFGSSRVFEAIPYFINKQVIEGGIVQSGLSSLFTYYIQCESSTQCAGFPRIMTPTSFNFTRATEHMKLYNVKHFIAAEPKVQDAVKANSEWKFLKRFGQHEVYELTTNDGSYVYVPEYEPVLTVDNDWEFLSMRWFSDTQNLKTPIAMVKEIRGEDKDYFRTVVLDNNVLWSTLLSKQPEFMSQWLLCGVFPNPRTVPYTNENSGDSSLDYGLNISYIDEENQNPVEGGECKNDKRWFKYYGQSGGFIDLYTAFEPDPESAIAYAATYVYSPYNVSVDLWYGSDDGVKIWLNNKLVHVNHIHRGTIGVQDKVELNLTRGWNLLLFKMENVVSAWGFYAKILDKNGNLTQDIVSRISPEKEISLINLKSNRINTDCSIEESLENEEITFTTTCPGKPHIIKVSYFPNWKVEGAERIYLVTPDFMLVYPQQTKVRLYYGNTLVDNIGLILTFVGLLIVILHFIPRVWKFISLTIHQIK